MAGISNHYDAMVSIQSIIIDAALDGMAGDPVIQEVLNYSSRATSQASEGIELPRVLIAPWGSEQMRDEVNNEDGTGYAIAVAIVCDASDDAESLEQRLAWRQTLRRRLHNRGLDGDDGSIAVQGVYKLVVEPQPVILPKAYLDDQKFVSILVVRCWSQEGRS